MSCKKYDQTLSLMKVNIQKQELNFGKWSFIVIVPEKPHWKIQTNNTKMNRPENNKYVKALGNFTSSELILCLTQVC